MKLQEKCDDEFEPRELLDTVMQIQNFKNDKILWSIFKKYD